MLAVLALVLFTTVPLAAQTGSIAGTATNPRTNIPAAGTRVEAIAGDRVVATATTDAAGRFQLRGLATGTYVVRIIPQVGSPYQLGEASVSAGQTTVLTTNLGGGAVDLDPIVVTASKRPEKAVNAPARVEVVGERAVDERPAVSMTEHLRNVPGVDIATTGIQSSNVVARGFNNIFSGSLHFLTDNRIAGVPSLRVNLLHFVPTTNEDVARMEVVLGPGAALYGPNTANGILHIITKSPLDDPETSLSLSAGSQDVFQGVFRTAHRLGENFGVKVSGQYFRATEFPYADPAEVGERAKFESSPVHRVELMRAVGIEGPEADIRISRIGQREPDAERWSGEARADWRVTPDLTTIFSVGTSTEVSGVELTGLGAAQAKNWRTTYYQARTNWNRLFAQVYLNTSDAGETFLLRNGAPIQDQSRLLVGQLQHSTRLGERQNFTYGVDAQQTTPITNGTINGLYEDDDETREFGAYLQSETGLSDRLELTLAGRVDTHSALPDPVFSPRAALVFKPQENQAFRVSFNRAFSTPSSLNQFLDLGSPIPGADPTSRGLSQLGYSLRVQGTGRTGFRFRQTGDYQMRSPFTPAALGGPSQLLPANQAALFFPAAVAALAQRAPLPPSLVTYLSSLRPTPAQIGTNFFNPVNNATGSLADLQLNDVEPIRESIDNTFEVGYKGIIGRRLLLAADVWRSRRENFVTPLTIQTPLLTLNPQQLGAYLVPELTKFYMAAGLPQAQAQQSAVALAQQLTPGLAQVPLGVISSADVHANSGQLLVTYTNVDEAINFWGSDLSATMLLSDQWSVSATASFVNDDAFETESVGLVTLNAPKRKGTLSALYRNDDIGFNGELRARYNDAFPVNSGVYIGTKCLGGQYAASPLAEECVDSYTLLDLTLGYRIPRVRGTSVQLSIQNLLGEDYRAFPGAPDIGRLALLRLKYEF